MQTRRIAKRLIDVLYAVISQSCDDRRINAFKIFASEVVFCPHSSAERITIYNPVAIFSELAPSPIFPWHKIVVKVFMLNLFDRKASETRFPDIYVSENRQKRRTRSFLERICFLKRHFFFAFESFSVGYAFSFCDKLFYFVESTLVRRSCYYNAFLFIINRIFFVRVFRHKRKTAVMPTCGYKASSRSLPAIRFNRQRIVFLFSDCFYIFDFSVVNRKIVHPIFFKFNQQLCFFHNSPDYRQPRQNRPLQRQRQVRLRKGFRFPQDKSFSRNYYRILIL